MLEWSQISRVFPEMQSRGKRGIAFDLRQSGHIRHSVRGPSRASGEPCY